MGPYATSEELATELNIIVTPGNTARLDACILAAALEIDHHLDLNVDVTEPDPGLLNRVNIGRGIEWWKMPDAYGSTMGTADTGLLTPPESSFERWAAMLLPLKTSWGLA